MSDKRFITNLVKDISAMDHGISKKEMASWEGFDMSDGQMLNTLDYVDSYIRN